MELLLERAQEGLFQIYSKLLMQVLGLHIRKVLVRGLGILRIPEVKRRIKLFKLILDRVVTV